MTTNTGRRIIGLIAVLTLAATGAFAQTAPAQQEKKHGMVWFWFDGAKKCNIDWDSASTERDKAFSGLAEKVKEGDKNKIRLYRSKVTDAQFKISMAWACGSDYTRNLNEIVGVALNAHDDSGSAGKMTEAEYDEAVSLIKILQKKIEGRVPTVAQRKIWDDAIAITGDDPEFYKLTY